jgi:hypothetical protein
LTTWESAAYDALAFFALYLRIINYTLPAAQVLQAKFLVAVTLMLLANCEHPNLADSSPSNDSCQAIEQPLTGNRTGAASGSSCMQEVCGDSVQQQVNPHPPFRGVFRTAIHACGLLQPLLALTLHSRPDFERAQRSSDGAVHETVGSGNGATSSATPEDGGQELQLGQEAVTALLGQVGGALLLVQCACMPHDQSSCRMVRSISELLRVMKHCCTSKQLRCFLYSTCSQLLWNIGRHWFCVLPCRQVVAAACQLLVAVNMPLDPVSCAHVLDYLWDQLTHKSSAAAAPEGQHTSSASLTGGHAAGTSNSGSAALPAAAPHHAATIWCLAQQPQHQQQLLLDGRWAQMLDLLAKPSLHRVKRAATASSRACTSSGGCAIVSASGSSVVLPRLQLQRVPGVQGFSSVRSAVSDTGSNSGAAYAAGSTAGGSCFSSGAGSSAGSSKRAAEAVRMLQLCLQSCWLLLQQEACMRQMAAELPAELSAVYAKGRSSWWALEMDKPR